jgi:hypothetical protein
MYNAKIKSDEIRMPTAFVLINTEIGSEADALKNLKKD